MRKRLLALKAIAFAFLTGIAFGAAAQNDGTKKLPTDGELLALAKKYVHTPITKAVAPNGDVFLQRNLTPYLQATVQKAPDTKSAERDHGHDHKDGMLRTFLNRPHPSVSTLDKYFNEAASEFGVPAELLKAVAQVQSNWTQVSESIYGSWGVMGLIENKWVKQISRAASLLNASGDAIRNDAKANIRAAAALLSQHQKRKAATKPEDWFDALKALNGLPDEALNHELALRIFDVLKNGNKSVTLWNEIINLQPVDVSLAKSITEPDAPATATATAQRTMAPDYPLAIAAFTTCNYNSRPAGAAIRYYFVHYVATGTYQGAINWFRDCASNVSAHYVVRNSDGQVSQVVQEADRAWSQGVAVYNDGGIGVEHEVLASNLAMWDSEPMLVSAANLCKDVCNRRTIPKVRRANNGDAGIYGHSDVRATDCPNMTPERWNNFLNRLNTVSVLPPTLYSIANNGSGTQVTATWKANTEPNLVGYRLYYATSDALSGWALAANESTLTAATTSVTLNASQFVVPPGGDVYHFRLTAVVSDGTNPVVESAASDAYSRSSNTAGPKVLVVDGFDRFGGNGSWAGSAHSFATGYFKALRNKAALQVSTVANEKVEDGTVSLSAYDVVVWFLGDESTDNAVFSAAEKTAIQNYLTAGGKLMVSGAEVAYYFGRTGTTTADLPFLNNYLKASYLADGAASYTPATGVAGTPFEGLTVPFGITYVENSPDAIAAVNGSVAVLKHNGVTTHGGVAYKGNFGTATTTPGALVYLSFALETAADTTVTKVMDKVLGYFDVAVATSASANDDAATVQTRAAKRIAVLANDYNNGVAFLPATVSIVSGPANGTVTVAADGSITYVSNPSFTGTDGYQYRVQNTAGTWSNPARVTLNVVAPAACNPAAPEVDEASPKRELRGAWVSTVSNIDWPSSRTLTTAQQQAELTNILNTLVATGINTVYLQVRPESDALYQSAIEPWSYWLTNAQGTAPNPVWDPLQFAVNEAHARGMELHAWLNPYRAKQSTPTLASNHVAALHPDWTFTAGTLTMLNPGLPEVRDHVTKVIADIATRYDVDGIHFDDYFYPSGMGTQDVATYTANNPTNIATVDDWRRNNVNLLIAKVYDTLAVINAAGNRTVQFGVSPFGIWKSGTPAGITGNSSYSALYCDPIAWLQAGKVDYVAPQLYWRITGAQDYNALSKWWNDQGVAYNRYVYPGLALYKMADANNWAASEIENQVALNRDATREQTRGQILFSTKQVMTDVKGIRTALQNNQFRFRSLPPAMPWKDAVCPNAPVNIRRDADTLRWDAPSAASDGDGPRRYVVYRFANAAEALTHRNDGRAVYAVVYANKVGLQAADLASGYYEVTALDKAGNESEAGAAIILPVTGLQLTVKLSGNTTTVGWRTITETNTKQFEVERSSDGQRFSRVAAVAAAGYSTSPRDYNLPDVLIAEGTYHYRIKTVDRDGRSAYSDVKSVTYKGSGGLLVGPNPFVSVINVGNLGGMKRLEVADMAGRIVLRKTLNNQPTATLDGGGLPAGMYHLRAVKADGGFVTVRLIKL